MAIWAAALPQKVSATMNATMGATMSSTMSAALSAARHTAAATPRRYMPGAPEIYFHKAIDNSRLVRAVDQDRKREMRWMTVAVVLFFALSLVYLGQHCRSIEYGYQIEELRHQYQEKADLNRTLKLEAATLKEPGRIDALAREMGMALPAVGQVQRMDDAGAGDSGAPVLAQASSVAVVSVPN